MAGLMNEHVVVPAPSWPGGRLGHEPAATETPRKPTKQANGNNGIIIPSFEENEEAGDFVGSRTPPSSADGGYSGDAAPQANGHHVEDVAVPVEVVLDAPSVFGQVPTKLSARWGPPKLSRSSFAPDHQFFDQYDVEYQLQIAQVRLFLSYERVVILLWLRSGLLFCPMCAPWLMTWQVSLEDECGANFEWKTCYHGPGTEAQVKMP